MAVIPSIAIPDADLPDVLESLKAWSGEAIAFAGGQTAYDALPDRAKVRLCIIGIIRSRTRNVRRERAERAISISDVGAT